MPDDFDLIHSYSRKQALADGVLRDVTATAEEAGFCVSVALTCWVWASCVRVPPGVEGHDERGRLWDLLRMLRWAIRRNPYTESLLFQLHIRTSNDGPEFVTLKARCGSDDDGSPCITIMLPEED